VATDRVIRGITGLVVVVVALIALYVSYRHIYELVSRYGESGTTARVVPLTVDGLVVTSSMVLLHSARHRTDTKQTILAWSFLALGILATLGANVAHGLGHGPIGAIVAAWPAAAFVGSYELLMSLVRTRVRTSTSHYDGPTTQNSADNRAEQVAAIPAPQPDISPNPNGQRNKPEYRQNNETQPENSPNPEDELFTAAQHIAGNYWNTHGRWIPREELRTQLRCSTKRASELLRRLKTESPDGQTPINERRS
jgi:hypothetical protein